jgi:glycosyltransferase involved in cell wall biosynthesis
MAGDLTATRQRQLHELVPASRRGDLVLLGGVRDRRELRWLLEHAEASVSVSALEAHPHGPAEAGALGCPLVLSDIPPHREVAAPAGRGVAYVPLEGTEALVEALRSPPTHRTPWTWPVTWDENARQLGAVFDEVLAR